MKDLPEIAPEIRGLLEEIVADPRSSIRLAPRRALRSWFDSGETVRAREVSGTKAERHLVEAHREALAHLLCEASKIAYWKAPILSHRPIGPDGKRLDPAKAESSWLPRAERLMQASRALDGVDLLRGCLTGITPHMGLSLAQASLNLVSSEGTRFYLALTVPWSQPRTAIALLERLSSRARPVIMRSKMLRSLAARECSVARFGKARETYQVSTKLDPGSPVGRIYAFNLSCLLGEDKAAIAEAVELGKLVNNEDSRVQDAKSLLADWWATSRSESERGTARLVALRASNKISEAAAYLCRAFEP